MKEVDNRLNDVRKFLNMPITDKEREEKDKIRERKSFLIDIFTEIQDCEFIKSFYVSSDSSKVVVYLDDCEYEKLTFTITDGIVKEEKPIEKGIRKIRW